MTRDDLLAKLAALKTLVENRVEVRRTIVKPNHDGGPPIIVGRYVSGSFQDRPRPPAREEEP